MNTELIAKANSELAKAEKRLKKVADAAGQFVEKAIAKAKAAHAAKVSKAQSAVDDAKKNLQAQIHPAA